MEFGVLGPLRAVDAGVSRAPTAPKQRQMLALLLLNANHVVSVAQFLEELWEGRPPSSAVAAVHTYVMHIRRTLGARPRVCPTAPERLHTRDQGYVLEVRPGELDLARYRDRLRAARKAALRGDIPTGAAELSAAEGLWHGPLLVDVTAGPLLRSSAEAIERDRLRAVSCRIRAFLLLGRHHELLGELAALVHRHTTDEDLAASLMLALYRSGRQADALTVFHRLRHTLREELGTSPSPRVQQLHMDLLAAHPRVEKPSGIHCGLSLNLLTDPLQDGAGPALGPGRPPGTVDTDGAPSAGSGPMSFAGQQGT
ncbi:AfsR/SARP family transcriptional regulator [Streptomyces sp. NPDC001985]|uniref:AfsR/SARP family transcriptional regulator n=1 Tax=Streptomyces sp. NPDC001985 TaxID=3154406 RepID=UPI00331DC183